MSFISTLFGLKSPSSEMIDILNQEDYKNAITKNKVQLIDVRTAREYNAGHISKAINIDFFQAGAFKKFFENFDKEKPVYIYCQSGNRSRKAAARLVEMGFEKIIDLKGGYMAWR